MTVKNPDDSYNNYAFGGPVFVTAPGTGSTITMKTSQRDVYVNNPGTYAALTIKLPLRVNPGEIVDIGFNAAVTALTVQDGFGNAITGSPTAGAAHTAIHMRYINATVGWVWWK